jgi:ATP synthase protein I
MNRLVVALTIKHPKTMVRPTSGQPFGRSARPYGSNILERVRYARDIARKRQGRREQPVAASIGKQREKSALQAEKDRDGSDTGWGVAVKVSSEFIAGIAVGAILGYGFDSYFETSPWGLIVLLMLGFAAGVLNVLRSVGKVADRPKL